MRKHFYGIEWPFGIAVNAEDGEPIIRVFRFESRQERDRWVEDGNPYTTQPGCREEVSPKKPEVRRRIEFAYLQHGDPWGRPIEAYINRENHKELMG